MINSPMKMWVDEDPQDKEKNLRERGNKVREWWEPLTERLLAQETAEDLYYECRIEDDDGRGIVRLYPLWYLALADRWDDMRRLYEKGYALHYRQEQEPAYESGQYHHELVVQETPDELYGGLLERMIFYSMEEPAEGQWLYPLLREALREEIETGRPSTGKLGHNLIVGAVGLQSGPAGSEQLEAWLEALLERIPEAYGILFGEKDFWYSVSLNTSVQETLGIPNFTLVTGWLAWKEKETSPGKKEDEEDRKWRWLLALEQSIGKLPGAVTALFAKEELPEEWRGELERLFERMAAFFRGVCGEAMIREGYERELRGALEGIEALPENTGAVIREGDRTWLARFRGRIDRELKELDAAERLCPGRRTLEEKGEEQDGIGV